MLDKKRIKLTEGVAYVVWWLDTECLLCEVDDCTETAIAEVEMLGIPEKAACYMHIGFAIEDQWLDAGRKKNEDMRKSIQMIIADVPHHLKNGGDFEYD